MIGRPADRRYAAVSVARPEVVVDDWSALVKASLAEDPMRFSAQFGI